MVKYFLILFFTGCCLAKEPVQITESVVRLNRVELKYRNGGNIAFLYWYNADDKQMYLQAVAAGDTVKYKPGMYRLAFMRH